MQKIRIVCVGTIKEKYFTEAINEYKKRLQKFCDFEIVEVSEYLPSSKSCDTLIKDKEASNILKAVNGYVVVLDLRGKEISSEKLSELIKERTMYSDSKITFVIGGSVGLGEEVIKKADKIISFGQMTFPHQLIRLMLSEQIYRAETILNNVKYHK